MLVELSCDKFRDGETVRDPIHFRRGLNAVVGSSTGANSIGKSTFLLAIDFCFGGKDYVRLGKEVLKQVGDHRICFAFEFDGTKHRFARHTREPDKVWKCDEAYSEEEGITLGVFLAWLAEMYGVANSGGSLRELTSGFFRIYGRLNQVEDKPLYAHEGDTERNGILRLLKLYGMFNDFASLEQQYKDAKEEHIAYKSAMKHGLVRASKSAAERRKNEQKITELEEELRDLESQSESGLADLDSVVAEEVADLRRQLSRFRRERTLLKNRLRMTEDDLGIEKTKVTKSFDDLLYFFPDANIRRLEEIEAFHVKLTSVLKEEHREASVAIKNEVSELDDLIEDLEERLRLTETVPTVSTAVLLRYANLSNEIQLLKSANQGYDDNEALQDDVKRAKTELDSCQADYIASIEKDLNNRLDRLNVEVCGASRTAPVIDIVDSSHYTYTIPKDGGAGSRNRGMFLFDVALLEGTLLPAFAHDTNAIKQVEDGTVLRLIEVYARQAKQVFLAIDKTESLTEDGEPAVLTDATVLRLGEGHELFGSYWPTRNQVRQ